MCIDTTDGIVSQSYSNAIDINISALKIYKMFLLDSDYNNIATNYQTVVLSITVTYINETQIKTDI